MLDVFPSFISYPSSTECAMAITALPSIDRIDRRGCTNIIWAREADDRRPLGGLDWVGREMGDQARPQEHSGDRTSSNFVQNSWMKSTWNLNFTREQLIYKQISIRSSLFHLFFDDFMIFSFINKCLIHSIEMKLKWKWVLQDDARDAVVRCDTQCAPCKRDRKNVMYVNYIKTHQLCTLQAF